MDNATTFPPPANGADQFEPPKAGDVVVISTKSGANVSGKLVLFDSNKGFVVIQIKGKEAPVKVPFPGIQFLHLPSPKQWITTQSDEPGEATTKAPFESFKVVFHDGTEMDGETIGFREDGHGIYLYPKYSLNKYVQSFVPFQSMKECLVGQVKLSLPDSAASNDETAGQTNRERKTAPQKKGASITEYLASTAITNPEDLLDALERHKSIPHLKLGEILVGENLATEEQIDQALEDQKNRKGTPLGKILIEKGVVTTSEIQQSLAKKLGIPFVNLNKFEYSSDALDRVPLSIAEQHIVIPIQFFEDKLVVAIENPMNWDALDAVSFHTNMKVEPVMATEEDIIKAISAKYMIDGMADESIDQMTEQDTSLTAVEYNEDDEDDEGIADNIVVKLLNKIIVDAQANDTSDIHIEPSPGQEKVLVRFRKDGSLIKYHEIPGHYKSALISRIKILAKLDISEKRRPQDGKIEFKKSNGEKLELRIAIVPTVNGQEDVVMRILASGKPIPLDKLGLSEYNYTELKKAVSKPYGLFLVCGPTGSGKTTTLHSVLGYINTPERKIWTAEDPVEITQKGLRQVQVNSKIGLDFAAAMRAFLRADPDVIMVGEMRDKETVHIGVEASLTGHLVFSTLHTNSAPESVVRLLDMGMDPFNFADALLGILAQRLAKRLCASCKEAYVPTTEEIMQLVKEYCIEFLRESTSEVEEQAIYDRTVKEWEEKFTQGDQFTLYRAVGCPDCDDSGYRGRIGLHELMIGSDAIKHDILEQAPVSKLIQTGLADGMRSLRQDGIEKVVQGFTDIKCVRAVCAK